MGSRKGDPRVSALKMASLLIAWGLAALLAYLGGVSWFVNFIVSAKIWPKPGVEIDNGLRDPHLGNFGGSYGPIVTATVIALPFAIGAIILFGMILRARPGITILATLSIVASIIGLAGSLFLFLATVVENEGNRQGFLIAVLTIVLIFVLIRLQRFVRRFYQRSPAFATLLFGLLAIVFIILSNGTTITSIILSQIDYWLALVAFGITLYASANLTRHSRKLPV
jgi:hypothetical protein